MTRKLYDRNPRFQKSCDTTGHQWAEFGAGMAQAMTHNDGPQRFLECVRCGKEWFIAESYPAYADRVKLDHQCTPGVCEGGHAKRDAPKRRLGTSTDAEELPPDDGPVRL